VLRSGKSKTARKTQGFCTWLASLRFEPVDQSGLRAEGVKVIKTPSQSPMCNAYAERFVRESRETLDNLILLGEQHFHYVLRQIEHHHNRRKPHQGLGNVVPLGV
jgi:transposase InsO family protein